MNDNARRMLEALRNTPNAMTREHAIDILENRRVSFSPTPAEELAVVGRLGGFLEAVVSGSIDEALALADELNAYALRKGLGLTSRYEK